MNYASIVHDQPNLIVTQLRKNLFSLVSCDYKQSAQRFFKEPIHLLGVPVPTVRSVSTQYFNEHQLKRWQKKDLFFLISQLANSEHELQLIGFDWLYKIRAQHEANDFAFFEQCLSTVSNWAACDELCTHALGQFLFKFPECVPLTQVWTTSDNRWFKRAAAVCLIYGARREKFLNEAFTRAQKLMTDPDDLVQKGYGWLLKESSKKFPHEVIEFVMNYEENMPRVAYRYALEKVRTVKNNASKVF
jgi:3-methyladenine DNA glycosylase AlkD